MDYLIDARGEEYKELNPNWKDEIEVSYQNDHVLHFYDVIWNMSLTAFDRPREVQVVIDSNDNLFISVGSGGLVTFGGQDEQTIGMKFPVKEWIHTHPFGKAYFSGTDLNTVFMYQRHMLKATVLGDKERATQYLGFDSDKQSRTEFTVWKNEQDEEEK